LVEKFPTVLEKLTQVLRGDFFLLTLYIGTNGQTGKQTKQDKYTTS